METANFKLQSMTGFGRGFFESNGLFCICEIRSVNHRGLEIKFRLPKELFSLEPEYIKKVQQTFCRGRIDVNISLNHQLSQLRKINFNATTAAGLVQDILLFCKNNSLLNSQISAGDLLHLPDLFTVDDSFELTQEMKTLITCAMNHALKDLLHARCLEGQNLFKPIFEILLSCRKMVHSLREEVEKMPYQHLGQLQTRINELLKDQGFDPIRLAQEAAFLADKSDVKEEIDRLLAHLSHFSSLCMYPHSGRKLDFLCQEMFRETNTISSKCADAKTAHLVVEIKADIERLREHVQNVE